MEIRKAIEILEQELRSGTYACCPDTEDATRMGHFALKEIMEARAAFPQFLGKQLPGETQESILPG